MCGINGVIFQGNFADIDIKQQLDKMNSKIIHRGPDEEGFFVESGQLFSIGMGMRRLSVIDLISGNQPIFSPDKKKVILFNGEIYNYKKLKKDLEQSDEEFYTKGDTEVILKLYEKHGVAGFRFLDGMFAFCIYDKSIEKVFIARDYFGEKPLYYASIDNKFLWASELKSLISCLKTKPAISKAGLNLFLSLTYIPAPFTIYENIEKLSPYHYIEYDLRTFQYSIAKINDMESLPKINLSFNEAKAEVKQKVFESVETRTVSDVPIGTFLSGGVDSSIVSLCVSALNNTKIDTFSIGFEKTEFDESEKARVVSKLIGSTHHEFIVNSAMLKTNIDDIILNFDEPFADSSALATYLVSKKTHDFVKVALTGDGGDEVFGGYNKYFIGRLNYKYTTFIPCFLHNSLLKVTERIFQTQDDDRGFRFKLRKLINAIDYGDNFYWDIISLGYLTKELPGILNTALIKDNHFGYYKRLLNLPKPKNLSDFKQVDKCISLEGDMLVKVDRTSMLNSLECRAPFLNKSLWEFTNSLPENYLINGWKKKHILKEAFKEHFPEGFLEQSKKGFGVPVGDWLRTDLRCELEKYIEEKLLITQGIFKVEKIREVVIGHLNEKRDSTFKVWTFFCFQKWYFNIFISI